MLETIKSRTTTRQVFRIARSQLDSGLNKQFISHYNFNQNQIEELQAEGFFRRNSDDPEMLLDKPFRPKNLLKKYAAMKTRFSAGNHPVFYSSLDSKTAKSEVKYWLRQSIGKPPQPRSAYFQQFSCTFRGEEKDLRPRKKDWPDLLNRCDYSFCNQLGAEAVESALDAIVTFSVRRTGGVNMPIFTRKSISDPTLMDKLKMTFYPNTGNIRVEHV